MDKSVIDLSTNQMLLTYIFVILAMIITSLNGLNRNKEFIIGTIRMTAQLFLAGFVLVYIFDSSSLVLSILMIFLWNFLLYLTLYHQKRVNYLGV